jgi:hypothetical protein
MAFETNDIFKDFHISDKTIMIQYDKVIQLNLINY